jgi:hypothetical protein
MSSSAPPTTTYTVHALGPFKILGEKEVSSNLSQWGLGQLTGQLFSFDQPVKRADAFTLLSQLPLPALHPFAAHPVACTATSMSLLSFTEEFTRDGVVLPCADESIEPGHLVSDRLRVALLARDSEDYERVADQVRDELLTRIFVVLLAGGGLNQYSNEVAPYKELARGMYKEMMAVVKVKDSQEIETAGWAFELTPEKGSAMFKNRSSFNRCYVTIDPIKRRIALLHSPYQPIW